MDKENPPYVQRVQTPTGVKLYFRRAGYPRRKLTSLEGTKALHAEVAAIVASQERVDRTRSLAAGAVGGMLTAYNQSADFMGLAASTRADYQVRIDELAEDVGGVLLADVNLGFVTELKTEWARRGYRVAALNLQVLKNACAPAVDDGRIPSDPFSRQKKVGRPHDAGEPNPIWRDAEVVAVIERALEREQPGLARAVGLARYAGFRRGTICTVPLTCRTIEYDDDGRLHRRLVWLTRKRRVLADKPEDHRLTSLLEQTPNRALTIAYNDDDQPFRLRGLNQALDRLIDKLALEGKVRPDLTLHGLRHSRGVELATAGASDAEIMSQLEQLSTRAAQLYRRQAERRSLADSGQAKIDRVLQIRRRRVSADEKSAR